MSNTELHLVEVYDGKFVDAHILKSMIEDAEIEVFVFDDNIGVIAPWNAAGGGAGAVRLMVSSESEELARQIVAEFEVNLKPE